MLKSLLTKADTLNHKITKVETNTNTIKTEIADINRNLEDFKEQHKQEFKELRKTVQDIETSQMLLKQQYKEESKELKKTVQDIETSQDLLSRNYEDYKDRLQQLTKDHKKLYEQNVDLKNEINNLNERKVRTDICSCKLSAKVSLMLYNSIPAPSLCKLNHISVCFIQIITKITCKQVIHFRESHDFLK